MPNQALRYSIMDNDRFMQTKNTQPKHLDQVGDRIRVHHYRAY